MGLVEVERLPLSGLEEVENDVPVRRLPDPPNQVLHVRVRQRVDRIGVGGLEVLHGDRRTPPVVGLRQQLAQPRGQARLTAGLAVDPLHHRGLHRLPALAFVPGEHAADLLLRQVGHVHAPLNVERRSARAVDAEGAPHADQGHAVQPVVHLPGRPARLQPPMAVDLAEHPHNGLDGLRGQGVELVEHEDERLRPPFGSEDPVEFVRRTNRPRVNAQRARNVRGDAPDHHAGVLHRLQVLHAGRDDIQPPIPRIVPELPHRLPHDPGLPALPGRPDGDVSAAVLRPSAPDQRGQHPVDQRRPRRVEVQVGVDGTVGGESAHGPTGSSTNVRPLSPHPGESARSRSDQAVRERQHRHPEVGAHEPADLRVRPRCCRTGLDEDASQCLA